MAARRLPSRYRRSGADPPFGDPRRAHGIGMEGYYWRVTDRAAGRAIVALCGVCEAPDGVWAVVALAAHPDGIVRHAVVPVAAADAGRLGVVAGDALVATEDRVRVDLGPGARLDLRLESPVAWPRRVLGGSGLGHLVPGLGQYWHPHVLGGAARGDAQLGAARVSVDGASIYAEKNWGSRFAWHWWWGQAQCFPDPDVCVAFAGGRIALLGAAVAPTAVVVRLGRRIIRLAPPTARTTAAAAGARWRVRARGAGLTVEIDGTEGAAALLPVPVVDERRVELRSRQVLAGRVALVVRRGPRVVFRGESALAGLERAVA